MSRILKSLVKVVVLCAGLAFGAGVLSALTSCSKEGVSRFKGNWSFKTSGNAVITPFAEASQESEIKRDTLDVNFVTESGQMDIVVIDKHLDQMKVTMNVMGGDVVQFDAVADGEVLNIKPFVRSVSFRTQDRAKIETNVTVSGKAHRYDDVIIFEFQYDGDCRHLGHDYHIEQSKVSCVAKLNDF